MKVLVYFLLLTLSACHRPGGGDTTQNSPAGAPSGQNPGAPLPPSDKPPSCASDADSGLNRQRLESSDRDQLIRTAFELKECGWTEDQIVLAAKAQEEN